MSGRQALVVDTGSVDTKAGFASDDHPRAIFSTVLGRPAHLNGHVGREHYDVYIGDEAERRSEELQLTRPLEGGRVQSWDDLERVWHHVFYKELRVAPEEGPLLMAMVPLCSLKDKMTTCEILFETLNVPALYLESQCVLSLYASGRTSGVVVDSGGAATHVSPAADGRLVAGAHAACPFAGEHVSRLLAEQLRAQHPSPDRWADRRVVEDIKRRHCYVSEEFACPKRKSYVRSHALPDGTAVDVTESHFCTEPLFQPALMGHRFRSLPEEIHRAVLKCDADVRRELLANVVVCGGNSLLRNFPVRLRRELAREVAAGGSDDDAAAVAVHAADERAVYPWLGGSMFAGLADAGHHWLLKKHFEEHGVKSVKNKFILK